MIRKLKEQRPDIVTAMGGSSCEGEMGLELFKRYPEIDYMGRGECDYAIVELAQALLKHGVAQGIPGILSRTDTQESLSPRPLQGNDLNELPYPNFDDYFQQLPRASIGERIAPALVMETSRGRWWGAVNGNLKLTPLAVKSAR